MRVRDKKQQLLMSRYDSAPLGFVEEEVGPAVAAIPSD